jgi:bacteriorhodopsin
MIVCGLVGALIESDYKWSFFVFGLLSLFYIVYHVLVPARASARLLGLDWGRAYARGAGLLLFVWMLYVSRQRGWCRCCW